MGPGPWTERQAPGCWLLSWHPARIHSLTAGGSWMGEAAETLAPHVRKGSGSRHVSAWEAP